MSIESDLDRNGKGQKEEEGKRKKEKKEEKSLLSVCRSDRLN